MSYLAPPSLPIGYSIERKTAIQAMTKSTYLG